MRVVKVSGHQLDDIVFLAKFCRAVAAIVANEPTVVVNGGGKSIKALQAAFDIPEQKVEGLRVTDAQSLWITEMVMSAGVNKLLVRGLQAAGVDAFGVSGVDGQLLLAQQKVLASGADLGFVGEVIDVRVDLISGLLDLGLVPVISPVSCDYAGQHYNINADEAATAIAQALPAKQLDFVSNVPGVKRDLADQEVIPVLTPSDVDGLIATEIVSGGMLPKVRAAVAALEKGVERVRIVDLDGMTDGGTLFKLKR